MAKEYETRLEMHAREAAERAERAAIFEAFCVERDKRLARQETIWRVIVVTFLLAVLAIFVVPLVFA